jgi:hypothetical protein
MLYNSFLIFDGKGYPGFGGASEGEKGQIRVSLVNMAEFGGNPEKSEE